MSKAIVAVGAVFFLGATLGSLIVHPGNELQKLGGGVEDLVNATLEQLRANLTDPIVIGSHNLSLTTGLTQGWLNVTNVTLQGLNAFETTFIKLTGYYLDTLLIGLRVPKLVLNLEYVVDLRIAEILPIYGAGIVNVTVDTAYIDISTSADVSFVPPAINGVTETRSILHIGNATFAVNGLFNEPAFDELINTLLNDTVVNFVNTHTEAIADFTSPIVEQIINNIIANV